MLETEIGDISKEDIENYIEEINNETDFESKIQKILKETIENEPYNDFNLWRQSAHFQKKYKYNIEDLLLFEDIDFVVNASHAILGKDIDSKGLNLYLKIVREEYGGKIIVLWRLYRSFEGTAFGVKVRNLKKEYIKLKITQIIMYKLPCIWRIFKFFICIFKLPEIYDQIQQIRTREHIRCIEDSKKLDDRFKEIHIQMSKQNINLHDINEKLSRGEFSEGSEEKLNEFQFEFLKKNTNRNQTKQNLKLFTPLLKDLLKKIDNPKILDLGSGRGEWLKLVNKYGIEGKGIDKSKDMIEASRQLGLDVEESDVVEYLLKAPSCSISLVTGFHIIEYLSSEKILKIFEEAYRILQPGGVILIETINPQNLKVGGCDLYNDITHKKPVSSSTLKFIAEHYGFKNTTSEVINPPGDVRSYDSQVNYMFTTGQDYYIVGYKE